MCVRAQTVFSWRSSEDVKRNIEQRESNSSREANCKRIAGSSGLKEQQDANSLVAYSYKRCVWLRRSEEQSLRKEMGEQGGAFAIT